jgi:co-chaperonin GroES (HSP10)
MKGYNDFIVHIPQRHRDTIKTTSGLELQADSRFSGKETANTVFEVVEIPLAYKGPVKKGFKLMVDPTLVMNQDYQLTGNQENVNLIDREKNLYKVNQSLIICYLEKEGGNWKGFGENLIVEKIKAKKEEHKIKNGIHIIDSAKKVLEKGKAYVKVINESLKKQGVAEGDIVFLNEQYIVDIRVGGQKFSWARTKHVIAKQL